MDYSKTKLTQLKRWNKIVYAKMVDEANKRGLTKYEMLDALLPIQRHLEMWAPFDKKFRNIKNHDKSS